MAQAPKFYNISNTLTENLYLTTSDNYYFLRGTCDPLTAELKVSIRGSAFTSDPDLVTFENNEFIIPNPSAYPLGLQLFQGDNTVSLRSVLSNGQSTSISQAILKLISSKDTKGSLKPPSAITIEKRDSSVVIKVLGVQNDSVVGYNFYASTQPGGGPQGYFKINVSPVSIATIEQSETEFSNLELDVETARDDEDVLDAYPQYFNLLATQKDKNNNILQTDFNESVEIDQSYKHIRVEVTLKAVTDDNYFSFEHDRSATYSSIPPTIPNSSFNAILDLDPLYYVVTAVYSLDGVIYESSYSPEVAGYPLSITPVLGNLPTVNRQQIVRDTSLSIYRVRPEIDLKPGSVITDVFINPFSVEADKLRFIFDYLDKSRNLAKLLQIDDPNKTGFSIAVSQSPYKQALRQAFYLNSDEAVQAIIDYAFDSLANRAGISRKTGERSRGQVAIYTKVRPTSVNAFGIGTLVSLGGSRFRLTSSATIDPSSSDVNFDPKTGRYSVNVYAQAEDVGSSYNIAQGQVGTIEGGSKGFSVIAVTNFVGGRDSQTNVELARRIQNAYASKDPGTYQGLYEVAVTTPSVEQATIVDAGHDLMLRDVYNGQHLYGKVDVWVKGEQNANVTDTFAFSFDLSKRTQFEIVGDVNELKFRVVGNVVTPQNPLIEVVSIPEYSLEFKNETKGYNFDLTNVEIIDYNLIQLDSTYNDPTDISLLDVITGYFRYRTSDIHMFERQPVNFINSFSGEVSGDITSELYYLSHRSDPLLLGRGELSEDVLVLSDPNNEIRINTTLVSDEKHVIVNNLEYLNKIGINPWTIKVYNDRRTVEYVSPYSSGDPDYTIIESDNKAIGIQLTSASDIESGQTISVDYYHDENYTVSYNYNALAGIVQSKIDQEKSLSSDVYVKLAYPTEVDIQATIVLKNGLLRNRSAIDSEIRSAIARVFDGLALGQPLRQSDIIQAIDSVSSVSYVNMPLQKMSKAQGSVVVREMINVPEEDGFSKIESWSNSLVYTYILKTPLNWNTVNGGDDSSDFRSVTRNFTSLELVTSTPNQAGYPLRGQKNKSFIIGSDGLVIPGFSDDTTLLNNYTFNTNPVIRDQEILTLRKNLTANRVVVTLTKEENPLEYPFYITYVTGESNNASDLDASSLEYFVLGSLDLSYDEDYDFKSRVAGKRV